MLCYVMLRLNAVHRVLTSEVGDRFIINDDVMNNTTHK